MAVYILSRLTIHDRAEYEKYENQFDEIFTNFNGKLLSVDEDPLVLAGEWEATRSVVIEFPSKKDALTWMQSDEYQRISKASYCIICNKPMIKNISVFKFCSHTFHSECVKKLNVNQTSQSEKTAVRCPFDCTLNPELTQNFDANLLSDLPDGVMELDLNYENQESEILRERFTKFLDNVFKFFGFFKRKIAKNRKN